MSQATDKGKQPLIQEVIDLSPVKEVINVQRKGKQRMVEKSEKELLTEQLREAREEIIDLKLEAKKHRFEKMEFNQIMDKWDTELSVFSRSMSDAKRLLKRTQPLRLLAKHTRKMNLHLQAEKRSLQNQVKYLQEKMGMIQDELKKRGLNITVINEHKDTPASNEKGDQNCQFFQE